MKVADLERRLNEKEAQIQVMQSQYDTLKEESRANFDEKNSISADHYYNIVEEKNLLQNKLNSLEAKLQELEAKLMNYNSKDNSKKENIQPVQDLNSGITSVPEKEVYNSKKDFSEVKILKPEQGTHKFCYLCIYINMYLILKH